MQTTAYELCISDWSSDVCSSDLGGQQGLSVCPRLRRDHSREIVRHRVQRNTPFLAVGIFGPMGMEDANHGRIGEYLCNIGAMPVQALALPCAPRLDPFTIQCSRDRVLPRSI